MTWDPSLVSFEAPPDGRIIGSVGGSTGNLTLLEGQTISFPWKRQQETNGADVATIRVVESTSGGVDYESMQIYGPSLTAAGTQATISLVGWEDDTSSLILAQTVTSPNRLVLTNGGMYSDSAFIAQAGATVNASVLDVNAGIDVAGGVVTLLSSGAKVAITSPDNYDVEIQGGDDIQLAADIDIRIQTTTGKITLNAVGDLELLGSTIKVNSVDIKGTVGQWTDHTPTLSQGTTVTKDVTYSRYWKYGRTVHWQAYLAVTSTGNNNTDIVIGLPVTAAQTALPVGTFWWSTGSKNYLVHAVLPSTTTVGGLVSDAAVYLGKTITADGIVYPSQLLSGHSLLVDVWYEAAS